MGTHSTLVRALCALAPMLAASAASGAFSLGFGGVSNNDADNVATGVAQLSWSAEELDDGPTTGPALVAFTIRNAGELALTVTRIYIDADIFEAIESVWSPDAGVAFGPNIGPPVLPGGRGIGFEPAFRIGALPPGPQNGVNPGESVVATVSLRDGYDFLDTLIGLNDGSVRLGLHVQSFSNGGSESFVNEELPEELIPSPGAMSLLLVSGLMTGMRGRRPVPASGR